MGERVCKILNRVKILLRKCGHLHLRIRICRVFWPILEVFSCFSCDLDVNLLQNIELGIVCKICCFLIHTWHACVGATRSLSISLLSTVGNHCQTCAETRQINTETLIIYSHSSSAFQKCIQRKSTEMQLLIIICRLQIR